MDEIILKKISKIEAMLKKQEASNKEVLSFTEAADYMDVSSSHLYKLTSADKIPCYKPSGKKLYFKRSELNEWILSSRHKSKQEIFDAAEDFTITERRAS